MLEVGNAFRGMLQINGRGDILRCMDYFRSADQEFDTQMNDAMEIILKKRLKNSCWPVQQKYTGLVHFDMEKNGKQSRWNTLRVLRVLKKYNKQKFLEIFI